MTLTLKDSELKSLNQFKNELKSLLLEGNYCFPCSSGASLHGRMLYSLFSKSPLVLFSDDFLPLPTWRLNDVAKRFTNRKPVIERDLPPIWFTHWFHELCSYVQKKPDIIVDETSKLTAVGLLTRFQAGSFFENRSCINFSEIHKKSNELFSKKKQYFTWLSVSSISWRNTQHQFSTRMVNMHTS